MSDLGNSRGRRFTLPLLWAAASILVLLLNGLPPSGFPDERGVRQTYYIVAHHHYVMSLAAWFVVFGAVYLVLEMLPRVRYRRELGYAQLTLAFFGTLLIVAPRIGLNLTALPHRYPDLFATVAAPEFGGDPALVAAVAVELDVEVDAMEDLERRGRLVHARHHALPRATCALA